MAKCSRSSLSLWTRRRKLLSSSRLLINFLLIVLSGSYFIGFSQAAPAGIGNLNVPWPGGAEDKAVSHSSEATIVSFVALISFVIFVILCTGGCCLNIFGKQRRDEVGATSFSNPIAELGGTGAATISPIDVRALEMDPIVFEPLPPVHELTPGQSNSFYNSLPRLDSSSSGRNYAGRHLNMETESGQFSSPQLAPVLPTDEASVYAHDWFDEPYRTNFRRDHIEYVKEVGKGWFGQVIEAEAKDIVPYARKLRVLVKVLREDATGVQQMRFLDESRLYRDANHGNVLKLLGHSIEKLPFLLIMEHCPQGDLKSFLIANVARAELLNSQGALVRMGLDIAKGLEWMSSADFIHKDLAARNCQVGSEGRIVIGDYGLAVENFRDDYYWSTNTAIPLRWSAPETLHCTINTIQTLKLLKSSNVWTFGVVLWEIVEFGKLPYYELSDDDVISRVIIDKNYTLNMPSRPGLTRKEDLFKIMLACWNANPEGRPSISAVVEKLEEICSSASSSIIEKTPNGVVTEGRWNNEEEDFDRKWNQVGERLNSTNSSLSPASTGQNNNHITNNNNSIVSKKKSVSFLGMTHDHQLPQVHIVRPGKSVSVSQDLLVRTELLSSDNVSNSDEKSLIKNSSSNNNTPLATTTTTTTPTKEAEESWKISGSDEDQSIELAVISEKVREKCQSVQNLMVLTHVEPSDLSDPESLIILAQGGGQVNGKNLSTYSTTSKSPQILTSTTVGPSKKFNGDNSQVSNAPVSSADSGTFTHRTASLGVTSPKSPDDSRFVQIDTQNYSHPVTSMERSESSKSSTFSVTQTLSDLEPSTPSVTETLTGLESSTSSVTQIEGLEQHTNAGYDPVIVTSNIEPDGTSKSITFSSSTVNTKEKDSSSWETLSEQSGVSTKPEVTVSTYSPHQSTCEESGSTSGVTFRVIAPTPSPNPIPSTVPAAHRTPNTNPAGNCTINVMEPTPTGDKGSDDAGPTVAAAPKGIKPSVRFASSSDDKPSTRVQQNYRARKTSTPNASPDSVLDSDESTNILGDTEVFQDFSLEISEPLSPIKKTKVRSNLYATGMPLNASDCGSSSVLLGPSDDLGLKPYQRVTTELNMLGSSSSEDFNYPEESSNGMSNATTEPDSSSMLFSESEGLQVPKSGFMDLFGHTGLTPSPGQQNWGTFPTLASSGAFSEAAIPVGNVVRRLNFASAASSAAGDSPDGVIASTTAHTVSPSLFSEKAAAAADTGSSAEVTHISGTLSTTDSTPRPVFQLGKEVEVATGTAGVETIGPKDKFVEDIEAATEELGSLVMTDLEAEDAEVKVIKETFDEDEQTPSVENTVINRQTKKAFEISLDETTSSVDADDSPLLVNDKKADETPVEYIQLAPAADPDESLVQVNESQDLLCGDMSDDDDKEEAESICREFVPSKWNQNLTPAKPAIKSPEQQKTGMRTPEKSSSALGEKSALKKSVSFERRKTQLVYEYPPPPVPDDSDEEGKVQSSGPLRTGGGQINASLDWELQPEELENADFQIEDWEDEVVPTRTDNLMDMYRISGFDNFQVRGSDEPFDFRPPIPPRMNPSQPSGRGGAGSGATSSLLPTSSFSIPPMNDTSTLGELRHTRSRLKLDLAKGEASLLDSESLFNSSSSTNKVTGQQVDSGVGSSTNVSPWNIKCDTSD